MSLRPLYLESGTPWQVRLDAGVALHVAAPGRTRSLYPLRRLARVVCGSQAEWRTDALIACLRAGVPVVFHDGCGDAVAWCFGPRRRETTLAQLLREGIEQPDWTARFGQWLEATARREALAALRALGTSSLRLDAAAVRSHLCNRHRLRTTLPAGPWLRALQHATEGLVAEVLHGAVGDPALIGFARPGLHLGQEVSALLEWRLHRILYAMPENKLHTHSPGRLAAVAVECHTAMLHAACRDLLGDLELQLRSWLL